jgi:hypothetical protein
MSCSSSEFLLRALPGVSFLTLRMVSRDLDRERPRGGVWSLRTRSRLRFLVDSECRVGERAVWRCEVRRGVEPESPREELLRRRLIGVLDRLRLLDSTDGERWWRLSRRPLFGVGTSITFSLLWTLPRDCVSQSWSRPLLPSRAPRRLPRERLRRAGDRKLDRGSGERLLRTCRGLYSGEGLRRGERLRLAGEKPLVSMRDAPLPPLSDGL